METVTNCEVVDQEQDNVEVEKECEDVASSCAVSATLVNSEVPVENMPFGCNLCSMRFKKKLFLNNHVEKKHGIKYVFTEKGKKVKLIRMPEEITPGEKLDPCVQALLEQNGVNPSVDFAVQTLGQAKRLAEECPTAHELDPSDFVKGVELNGFGAGILVETIKSDAMKRALLKKVTPFAVFRPFNCRRLYLMSIYKVSDTKQFLFPSTLNELKSAGLPDEKSFYYSIKSVKQPDGTSSMECVKKDCTRFERVAIVALVEQQLTENNDFRFVVLEPISVQDGRIQLLPFDEFARLILHSKPKRLRCLSIPPKPQIQRSDTVTEPQRMKRKYTKRGTLASKNDKKKNGERKRGRPRLRSPTPEETEEESSYSDASIEIRREKRKKREKKPRRGRPRLRSPSNSPAQDSSPDSEAEKSEVEMDEKEEIRKPFKKRKFSHKVIVSPPHKSVKRKRGRPRIHRSPNIESLEEKCESSRSSIDSEQY